MIIFTGQIYPQPVYGSLYAMKHAEKAAEEDREFRRQRQLAEREWISGVSRSLFWIGRSYQRNEKPNGELESAIQVVQASEEKIKTLERGRVANMMND